LMEFLIHCENMRLPGEANFKISRFEFWPKF
jgi:hypothetical protein